MTKETITIRIEELQTIRLVFPNGLVHEMPLGELKRYADDLPDKLETCRIAKGTRRALQ